MKKIDKKTRNIIIIAASVVLLVVLVVVGYYVLAKLYGWGDVNQHDATAYSEDRELLTYREPFVADYIWIKDNGTAVWAAFSKDIYLDADVDTAILDISCDTYYWLWVNGREIVWEGCLKRGVTPDNGFYDSVEIKDTFKAGKNTVSILVRHLGDDGFSHKDSGQGGLVVEGTIGDAQLLTDGTWKAKKYAYEYRFIDYFKNYNYRLSERGSRINGREYTEFWQDADTDDWDNVVVLDKAYSEKTFGKCYLNPLPQKAVSDVIWLDLGEYDFSSRGRKTLTLELEVNSQFCPCFELEADRAGRKITYYTENALLNYRNVYITKRGENNFVDFAWINGEKLYVTVDKGVSIKRIGYRVTGYNATRVRDFDSSDAELNALWRKAANTLLVTMRDSYMDCPDRERAEWIGDAVIESEMSFYALSPESQALFRKAIVTTYGWVHADGVIQTVVPDGVQAYELPLQNLAFLVGCVNYVDYSGDTSVVPMILSMAEGYLPLWHMKDGLVAHRSGSWDWGDWGNKIDMAPLENAWYYYAASRLLTLADPESDFAAFCKGRMDSIAEHYSVYYKSCGIAGGKNADDRANAIAVLAGLYRESDRDVIIDTLFSVRNSSPYMEKYVEQALCELGRTDLALTRAKEVYANMIADECTTLWEFWNKNSGTTNHAWAGGTLVILSRYLGGVYPTDRGFATFAVKPDLSVIDEFSVELNPTEGVYISVVAERISDTGRRLTVTCSSEGGTLMIEGKDCIFNGSPVASESSDSCELPLQKGINVLVFDVE